MLPDDLPQDLPTFIARFGTDEACRDYLFRQRWPAGFRCRACAHGEAWTLGRRHIYECTACGQQHSLLTGTIFEQTKTGLAKWFLAIDLVTASKSGISAIELRRQMGFGSCLNRPCAVLLTAPAVQTDWPSADGQWSWLHKIRNAMVRPGRQKLRGRVEADVIYLGAAKPGRPGRGAAGKALVAGAVETARGKARGRRLGRLRLARLADAASLEGFVAANVARPAAVATDGWSGYAGLAAGGYRHEPVNLSTSLRGLLAAPALRIGSIVG